MAMSNLSLGTPASNGNGQSEPQSRGPSFSSIVRPSATSPTKKKRFSNNITNPLIIAPSLLEDRFGASLGARTSTLSQFQDVGPPDLLHICKYNKSLKREEGEYHFLTGVDLSSEVAAIAYISTLNFKYTSCNYEKHPTCFTYCGYNAFSKEDVRIRKEFPGTGYSLRTVPNDRNLHSLNDVSEKSWEEVFVCGIVRAVVVGLDDERKLPALVEKSIFQSVNSTKNIICQLVRFIDRGHLLGASEAASKPSIYQNYLLDALYSIVEISGLVDLAISEIQNLKSKYDLSLIVVKLLLQNDREIQAIKILHRAIKLNPRDPFLLNEQARFLLRKGSIDLATSVAHQSSLIDAYDFDCWWLLAKAYLYNKDHARALVALNNAQMIPLRQKALITLPQRDKLDMPFPNEGKVKAVWESLTHVYGPGSHNLLKFSPQYEIDAVDPMILRVNRFALKGSMKQAYELLVLMVDSIGWDALLKIRSEVFIMDTEITQSASGSASILEKRICEPWLESLLSTLFSELRISMIFAQQLTSQTKHSALEWSLIGLTCRRTHYFSNAVSSLRTTINNKFDIISARALLQLWSKQRHDLEFQAWQRSYNYRSIDKSFDVPLEQLIDVIVKSISYHSRFYNECGLEMLMVLKRLFGVVDVDYISSRVQILLEKDDIHDWNNSGCIPVFDSLVKVLQKYGQL